MVNERIIVMSGSFNPPTIAHLRLLVGAVNALNANKGIFVPSSQNYGILTQPFTFWLMAIRSIFFHGGTVLTNL